MIPTPINISNIKQQSIDTIWPCSSCSPLSAVHMSAVAAFQCNPHSIMHHVLWAAGKQAAGDSVLWSAKVGSTKAEQEGSGAAGSSSMVALDTSAEPKQAVLLLPVNMTASAGECVQHVVGAWLQSILRKYAQDPHHQRLSALLCLLC